MKAWIKALGLALASAPAVAVALDEAQVRAAIAAHLEEQSKSLPGSASYQIGPIATPSLLHNCAQVRVEAQAGARPWGATRLRVVCVAGAQWSMLVPVEISVVADYLITARPLAAGAALGAGDLATRHGPLESLPADILTEASEALGRSTRVAIPGGGALRRSQLRAATVIRAGQNVPVQARGAGFEVSSQGEALSHAEAGATVRVRLPGGRVVSGRARADGSVEVAN